MKVAYVWLFVFAWFASGAFGAGYAWTRSFPLRIKDMPIVISGGILGPMIFPIGLYMEYGPSEETVLIREQRHG